MIPNRCRVHSRGVLHTPRPPVLDLLTARQRECLAAWTFDGLGIRRIGRLLGLSRITVRQHIMAARQKLTAAGIRNVCRATQERTFEFRLMDHDQ